MGKRLFLLLIICLFGVVVSPTILTAADDVVVSGVSNTGITETVPLPDPEPEMVSEVTYAPAAPVAGQLTVAAPQVVNYTVTGYSGGIEMNPVGIVKTGSLVYGHNSWNVMGSLANRYMGEVFTITEGGAVQNYQVSAIVMYEKTADGYLNGDPYLMGDIVYGAMGHSVALMTCAGQMLGGGDATHRLVVFADAV
ncbi:hypothetical protein IKF21_02630 [Candidatus Saccharibacteria bacterium]|nr:hypothetical protein [Candidatus Saccharibacteria bacterium]